MDPYPQGFPFGIMDVAQLLHLKMRRRQADSAYVDCPFCGDRRGKMNISFTKNVWRCNYCGESGGMLALYARANNITNSDAYREVCDALLAGDTDWGHGATGRADAALGKPVAGPIPVSGRGEVGATAGNSMAGAFPDVGDTASDCGGTDFWKGGIPQAERASAQEIHQTYSLLLSMLSLSPAHRTHLRSEKRGLTDSQIDSFGFKSTPPYFLCRSLAERLLKQGCTVEGVPGFYLHEKGYWTVSFSSRASGILIPAIGVDGLVKGMQILLDKPFKDRDDPPEKPGTKYIWLSSASKNRGVTSGSPVHFVGDPFAKAIYVTEGLLKADIAHCLTERSFLAVAGANNVQQLDPLFALIAQNGTEMVIEAHDMDKYSNEMIANGSSKICQIAMQHGMECRRLTWNPNYKGIDDWQLALRKEKEEKAQEGGKGHKFKEKYIYGKCGMDSFGKELTYYSGLLGDDAGIAESLGLAKEEYAVYCRDGIKALEKVLDTQRQSRSFRIYQLSLDGGKTVPFAFKGIRELQKAGYSQPPAALYRLTWDSAVTCPIGWADAEILGYLSGCFRGNMPEGYRGRPLAPSDIVELKDGTGRHYFYVDGTEFVPVRFSPFLAKPLVEDAIGADKKRDF